MLQLYQSFLLLVASLAVSNARELRLSFDDASLQYQPSVCNSACGTTCDKQWFDGCPQGSKSERMTKVDEGTSLQFDFQGDSIAWHSRIFPQGGIAYVSIDGGATETVDTSSSASRPENDDAVVWTKTGLDATKNHHIVIHFDTPTTPSRLRIREDDVASGAPSATPEKPEADKTEGDGSSSTAQPEPTADISSSSSASPSTTSASEPSASTTATNSASDPILSVKAEPTPPAAPGSPPPPAPPAPPALPAGAPPQPAPQSGPGRGGPGQGPDRHGRPGHEGEGPGQASPPPPPPPSPAGPPAPPAPPAEPQQPSPPPAPPAAAPQQPAQPPVQPPVQPPSQPPQQTAQQTPKAPTQAPAAAAPAPPIPNPVVPVLPGNSGAVANPAGSQVQIAPLPTASSLTTTGILSGGPNRFISIKQFIITSPDGIANPADPNATSTVNSNTGDGTQSTSQDPTVNMAAVGGGIAAGVVLLGLLGGFFYVERRKKLKRKSDSEDPFAGTDARESKWRQLPDDVEAQRNSGPSITVSPPGVGRRTTIIHRSEVISQQPSLASQNTSLAPPESIASGHGSSIADAPPGEFLEKSEIEAYNYRWSLFTAPPVGAVHPGTAQ